MRASTVVSALVAASATLASASRVKDIWTFPLQTWVENLAVRPDGQIVATLLNVPQVYQVDPAGKVDAALVAEVPGKLAVFGISQLYPDIYYIHAGNFSHSPPATGAGTFSVYKLDLTAWAPGAAPVAPVHVADMYEAGMLDGNAVLDPAAGTMLFADTTGGAVWRVDVNTGAVTKLVADPLMAPVKGAVPQVGINGVKVLDGEMYWTNSNQNLIAKAPCDASGRLTGPAKVLASNVTTADDLYILSRNHGVSAGASLLQRFRKGAHHVVSAAPLVAGATAVRPGSCPGSFYVTTNGGVLQYATGNFTSGGKVVEVFT